MFNIQPMSTYVQTALVNMMDKSIKIHNMLLWCELFWSNLITPSYLQAPSIYMQHVCNLFIIGIWLGFPLFSLITLAEIDRGKTVGCFKTFAILDRPIDL